MAKLRWGVLSTASEPGDIRRSPALGGGTLNDLGCYCVSAISLFAGEPDQVNAIQLRDGPGGVDLVGTDGRLTVPVEPEGAFALTDPDHDVYRIQLDTISATLAAGGVPPFGRPDAIAQATVLEALDRSAELGTPVDLTAGEPAQG